MEISISISPKESKKYQAIFDDWAIIHFGASGYSDYTMHKDAKRMRSYVRLHGGGIHMDEKDPDKVNYRDMLRVVTSSKENWDETGIKTAGFWSRWLLWSHPNIQDASKFIEKRFNVKITLSLRAQ